VPCGSSGISCSKSVTLRVGSSAKQEIITFTREKDVPSHTHLGRYSIYLQVLMSITSVKSLSNSILYHVLSYTTFVHIFQIVSSELISLVFSIFQLFLCLYLLLWSDEHLQLMWRGQGNSTGILIRPFLNDLLIGLTSGKEK
jgi:hypothetical protein